jgi:spore maturation protein CgeB
MRLLKIGVYADAYLRFHHARHSALAAQPYAIQHSSLMNDCFGSSDFWTTALRQLNYETCELVINVEAMQKRWALEQGASYRESDWMFDIATAQVKAFRPDVLIVADYSTVTAAFIRQLRLECPNIRLVLIWCGAPFNDASIFREADIVLSCVPELITHFRENGHRSEHLNHAFEPRVLERIDATAEANTDFAFLGSINKSARFHHEREKILLGLVEAIDVQLWSDTKRLSLRHRRNIAARQKIYDGLSIARRIGVSSSLLNSLPVVGKAARWESRPQSPSSVDERLTLRARAPLFGLEMFQQLRQSKVVLNTHIDISSHSASNLRLFEATGVGACLLTDWKENMSELFEPDAEAITYRSVEECVEKAQYLLSHEDERRKIAAAGQRRTLREHTYAQRAEQLDQLIRAALS